MNTGRKSRVGGALATIYLVAASVLFYQAFTCTGWVCDLVALPAALPLGIPIGWLIDWIDWFVSIPGHTPSFHMRKWYFIVPTVAANACLYYWLGRQLEKLGGRLRRRLAQRR